MTEYLKNIAFICILALTGCADTDKTLWTRSNTLPLPYSICIELKGDPTESEDIAFYKVIENVNWNDVLAQSIKEFNNDNSDRTQISTNNVKIVKEHDFVSEPGQREFLYIFRYVRITTDYEKARDRVLFNVNVYLSEITSTPRDAIGFPPIFKKILLETYRTCLEAKATEMGLLRSS